MKQKFFSTLLACLFVFVVGGVAMAADPSTFTVDALKPDMANVGTLATAVCGGLFAIWGIRKVIKMVNRS